MDCEALGYVCAKHPAVEPTAGMPHACACTRVPHACACTRVPHACACTHVPLSTLLLRRRKLSTMHIEAMQF
eukprot:365186-Chlamydomonas_euryale.AAC.10